MNICLGLLSVVSTISLVVGCSFPDDEVIRKAKEYNSESEASFVIDAFVSTHHRMPKNKAQVIEFLDTWIRDNPEVFIDGEGDWLRRYFEDKRTRMVCFDDSCFLYSPINIKNGYALYGCPKDWLELWLRQGRNTDFFSRYTDVFFRKDNTPILSMMQYGGSSSYINLHMLYLRHPHCLYVKGEDNTYRICAVLMFYCKEGGLDIYSTIPDSLYVLSGTHEYIPCDPAVLPGYNSFRYDLEQHISHVLDSLKEANSTIFYCPLYY